MDKMDTTLRLLLESSYGHGDLEESPFSDTLASLAVDYHRPVMGTSGMEFYLGGNIGYSGRLVKGGSSDLVEGWSPVVDRIVPFPGDYDSSLESTIQLPSTSALRSDCHTGPYDSTISPQPYQPLLPYLPFVLRDGKPSEGAEWTSPEIQ
jgi:hypothetical protein